jgi:NAD(P)H-dependent flavin oxidoreductase YrpB (nitropropane dioxygenase family)
MGQAAGGIKDVKTADQIVQDMMKEALETLRVTNKFISRL